MTTLYQGDADWGGTRSESDFASSRLNVAAIGEGLRMTTVLIAVDDTETAAEVARRAHGLFGDDADYLVMHVGEHPFVGMNWGYPYVIQAPGLTYPTTWPTEQNTATSSAVDLAEQQATDVANAASLHDATTVGSVGDPASAILRAGHEHHADVIVIGSHDRSWFSRLVKGSVEHDLVHDADLPVLIINER
jgi:nucleotide-binding universal stress UspA family protein